MENKFAVMHIEKYKTMSAMTKSYNHNYRRLTVGAMSLGETCDSFKNVQLDKIHLESSEYLPVSLHLAAVYAGLQK